MRELKHSFYLWLIISALLASLSAITFYRLVVNFITILGG